MVTPSSTSWKYSETWPNRNTAPMNRVSRYQRRSPKTSPFSAANTPSWQVNDEATRMMVNGSAHGRLSTNGSASVHPGGFGGQFSAVFWAFTVKNIAKSPAKNISSLESQTIVPTLTMLGRFSECTRWLIVGAAVVTPALCPFGPDLAPPGSCVLAGSPDGLQSVA